MSEIKIGTLNVQNSGINRLGGDHDDFSNTEILGNYIINKGFYFLGTQELTRVFSSKLLLHLNDYKLYGDPRYGKSLLARKIKFIDSFNESNAIITNRNVLRTTTNLLPWFPNNISDLIESLKNGSIMPRIITFVEIQDSEYGNIFVLNTHLDYQLKNVQTRQLKSIYKLIEVLMRENKNIVLTGDFNMEVNFNDNFEEFITGLQKLGLVRVPVNDKTNALKFPNQTAIDHIFIPVTWQINNAGIIESEDLSQVTDHKGIYANVKIR